MSTLGERNDTTGLDLTGQGGEAARRRVGGKAETLARLRERGLMVPELAAVPAGTPDVAVDAYAAGLAERFSGSRLAVRSSGVEEDGATASFAGQFLTLLDVDATPSALADAIRRVRASADDERVRIYAGESADLGLAVLVMPMVDATAAGVAFTRDPVTGADEVVIEAVQGRGDQLVSGEVPGERWTVAGTTVLGGGDALTSDGAVGVADLARTVEELEGTPQDIEWAYDADGVLHLLQARPITALASVDAVTPVPLDDEPPPGPWMWDSTHCRRPTTPLAASIFPAAMERGSRRLAQEYGMPIDHLRVRPIGGYFHIQVVPPVGEPGATPPPRPLFKLANRLHPAMRSRERTATAARTEGRAAQRLRRWVAEVRPEVDATLASWWQEAPEGLDDQQLLADRLEEAAELQQHVFAWNMVTDLAYLEPLHALVTFLEARRLGGLEDALALVAGSSPSEYLASLGRVADAMDDATVATVAAGGPDLLDRLDEDHGAIARAYADHRTTFGSRLLGYDYDVPAVGEDPVAELRHAVALRGRSVSTAADDAARDRARSLAATLSAGDRDRFDALVAEARRTYPAREEGEGVHARAGGMVRRYALVAGQRLVAEGQTGDPEDAVLLSLEELTAWLRDRGELRDLLARRRGERRWAELHPPRRGDTTAARPPDADLFTPNVGHMLELMTLVVEHDAVEVEVADGADGVGASAGTFTGPVRVVSTPDGLASVRPGEVLVSPLTTSAWEHVFPVLGALVCEGGGLLSHPAIIAREHGLPAVVGCRDATRRFRDGQIVTVDGSRGTVDPRG